MYVTNLNHKSQIRKSVDIDLEYNFLQFSSSDMDLMILTIVNVLCL